MKHMLGWMLNFRMSFVRGRLIHLRMLAEEYEAKAQGCRADANAIEKQLVQMQCRRLLTQQAVQECRYG